MQQTTDEDFGSGGVIGKGFKVGKFDDPDGARGGNFCSVIYGLELSAIADMWEKKSLLSRIKADEFGMGRSKLRESKMNLSICQIGERFGVCCGKKERYGNESDVRDTS